MKKDLLFLIIIVLGISILIVSSHWEDAPTIDEVIHIGSGYSYLKQFNMRLNPEHPPLAKDLAAIPLVFKNIEGGVFNNPYWKGDITPTSQWAIGKILLYQPGNDADNITRTSRFMMLLFFILSAILIFKWSYQLFGRLGAYIALCLFSFSPTIIAHSGLVTTDMAALTGIFFATYFFIKYLKKQTTKNFITAGLLTGLAFLIKFSTLLLIPFFVLLGIIYGLNEFGSTKYKLSESLRLILVSVSIFIIGFTAIILPAYLIHLSNYEPIQQNHDTQLRLNNSPYQRLAGVITWMSDKPVLRAISYYGVGLLSIRQRASVSEPIYFLGEIGSSGQKKYFPIVYLLKEPLPWLMFVLFSILVVSGLLIKRRKQLLNTIRLSIKNYFSEFSMLLWIIIYLFMSINSKLNIGIRHLLPIYPFLFILVASCLARTIDYLKKANKLLALPLLIGIWVIFSWYILESLYIWPNYLTYFNQIAGGSKNGYRYAVDSNLDWGQDLKRFAQWVDNKKIPKIEFDYFGFADEEYYLGDKFIRLRPNKYKNAEEFLLNNQSDGWVGISATNLFQRSENKYQWILSYEPLIKIGNSIWVWHIKGTNN